MKKDKITTYVNIIINKYYINITEVKAVKLIKSLYSTIFQSYTGGLNITLVSQYAYKPFYSQPSR
jgi:hypothetical protein